MTFYNHPLVRKIYFALTFMVLMSYTLYFSKSYVKLIVPSTITEINVKNISSVAIPSIIVQTAKNINATGRLSQSFKQLNPNHTYMFFDDKQAEEFVRQHMPPDIIHAYEIMPVPVLKADYFRYIAIYVLGGVYTDIDTECLRPIDKWTDNSTNVSFIVAVEAESPLWKTLYARPLQLCQWTFASMPKHPILKRMIDNVAQQTRKFINSKLGYSSVMDWTGPGVWTDTIFDYINETYHIESRTVSKLQHGRLVGDIYFLPIPAFDPLAYLMGAKGRTDPEARVFHHFHGSWKTFSSTARTRSSVSPNSTGSRPFSKL